MLHMSSESLLACFSTFVCLLENILVSLTNEVKAIGPSNFYWFKESQKLSQSQKDSVKSRLLERADWFGHNILGWLADFLKVIFFAQPEFSDLSFSCFTFISPNFAHILRDFAQLYDCKIATFRNSGGWWGMVAVVMVVEGSGLALYNLSFIQVWTKHFVNIYY